MRIACYMLVLLLLPSCALQSERHESGMGLSPGVSGSGRPNHQALLATVNTVDVLDFDTERPVRRARLLIDGKIVDTTGAETTAPGLKVAVVPGNGNITIHLQVPNMGWLLRGGYSRSFRADVMEKKRCGPGKMLVLSDWTEVFGLREQSLGGDVLHDLSVEVK